MRPEQAEALKALRGRYGAASLRPSDAHPDVIYHYTTAAGLHGIVTSGILRRTNYSFLNDSQEVRFGLDLATRILDSVARSSSGPAADIFAGAKEILAGATTLADYYLACFCEDGDLLSQWRGYGNAEARYCIGFDVEELIAQGVSPHSVIYDPEEQEERVRTDIGHAQDAITKALPRGEQSEADRTAAKTIRTVLTRRLMSQLHRFKHSGFSEEQEWRIVGFQLSHIGVDFQPAGGILRPFTNVVVGKGEPPRLPIVEVVVGPSRRPERSLKAAKLLLASRGYKTVKVRDSKLPFQDA